MTIKDYKCKCGHNDFFFVDKENQKGIYCTYCGKPFVVKGNAVNYRNRKDRHQSGYFCSRQCSGKYGAAIQNKKLSHIKVDKVSPEKIKLHQS